MKKLLPIILFLFVLLFRVSAFAESVTLGWDANTESDLAGYKVYTGTVSGTYTSNIDVGNVVEYTTPDLIVGTTYYWALTAYDTSGNESGYSSEVFYLVIDTTAPGVPANTKIIRINL